MKAKESTLVFFVSKTEYQGRSVHYVVRSNISSSWEYDITLENKWLNWQKSSTARKEVVDRIGKWLKKWIAQCPKPYVEIKFNEKLRIEHSSSSRELFLPITEEEARCSMRQSILYRYQKPRRDAPGLFHY